MDVNPYEFWAMRGIGVIPLKNKDKVPFVDNWQKYADNPAPPELRKQWSQGKNKNHGVICGERLVIFDFESEEVFKQFFSSQAGLFESDYVVKTGKGYHLYAEKDMYIPYQLVYDKDGVLLLEIRTGAHQCVGAGSIHPNGKTYEKVGAAEPRYLTSADFQAFQDRMKNLGWIVKSKIEKNYENLNISTPIERLPRIPQRLIDMAKAGAMSGSRNSARWRLIRELYGCGVTLNEAKDLVIEFSKHCVPPDLEEKAVSHLIQSWAEIGKKYPPIIPHEARVLKLEAHNNGAYLLAIDRVCEDITLGKQQPSQLPATIANVLMKENEYAYFFETDELRMYKDGIFEVGGEIVPTKKTQEYLTICERQSFLNRNLILEVIGHIKRTTLARKSDFDLNTSLLILENGVLEIGTKQFSAHSSKFKATRKLPIAYNPEATCPSIDSFFSSVTFPSDKQALYEIIGVCLYTKENYQFQKAIMLYGSGCNGKSTYINLLKTFLGPNNVSARTLQELENNRFAAANLQGKLANVFADLPSKALKNLGMFKTLTGGDLLTTEAKYGKLPAQFVNTAKLIFSANNPPETFEETDAFFRRWHIITFPHSFLGREDKGLAERLTAPNEISGLLNKALEALGTVLAQGGKLSNEQSTEQVKNEYLRISSPISYFMAERVNWVTTGFTSKQDLVDDYDRFCVEEKLVSGSAENFFRSFKAHAGNRIAEERREKIRGFLGFCLDNGKEIEPKEEPKKTGLGGYIEA